MERGNVVKHKLWPEEKMIVIEVRPKEGKVLCRRFRSDKNEFERVVFIQEELELVEEE